MDFFLAKIFSQNPTVNAQILDSRFDIVGADGDIISSAGGLGVLAEHRNVILSQRCDILNDELYGEIFSPGFEDMLKQSNR